MLFFFRLCQAKCRGLYKRLFKKKNPIIFWKSSDAHSGTVLLRYWIGSVTLALLGKLRVIFLSYLPSSVNRFFLMMMESSRSWKLTSRTLKAEPLMDCISVSYSAPFVILTTFWLSAKTTCCNFCVSVYSNTPKERHSEVSILTLCMETENIPNFSKYAYSSCCILKMTFFFFSLVLPFKNKMIIRRIIIQ